MKGIRGEVDTDNLIELILAGGGVIILVVLFFQLFAPSFDVHKETMQGYFDAVSDAVSDADISGISELSFFVLPDETFDYFLMYFDRSLYENIVVGERSGTVHSGTSAGPGAPAPSVPYSYPIIYRFSRSITTDYALCICGVSDDISCENEQGDDGKILSFTCLASCELCLELSGPMTFSDNVIGHNLAEVSRYRLRTVEDGEGKRYLMEVMNSGN